MIAPRRRVEANKPANPPRRADHVSAAVAGLLGRSGPDTAAERTANATEAMEEHLAAIRDDVEEGGLAFE